MRDNMNEAYESWRIEALEHRDFIVRIAKQLGVDLNDCYSGPAIHAKIEAALAKK